MLLLKKEEKIRIDCWNLQKDIEIIFYFGKLFELRIKVK
jgi:hypothetical protein